MLECYAHKININKKPPILGGFESMARPEGFTRSALPTLRANRDDFTSFYL